MNSLLLPLEAPPEPAPPRGSEIDGDLDEPRPRRGMRRVFAAALFAAVAVAGLAGYLYLQAAGGRSTPFQTAPVTQGPLVAAISATGTLNAVITVQVGSQVSGQIRELHADFNSPVRKGQIIARVDPDIFQSQVSQATAQLQAARAAVRNQQAVVTKTRADLETTRAGLAAARAQTAKALVTVVDSRRNLARQDELHDKDLVAQADLDSAQVTHDSAIAQHEASLAQERAQAAVVQAAEAQLGVSEAALESAVAQVGQQEAVLGQAKLNLEHTIIRAPVDGVVVSRNVDVGQTVAASLQAPTLFVIAQDLTRMQVDANVDEADVGRVRVGQSVSFTVDAFPAQAFSGQVVQVRKAAQVVQNVVTYDVVASAPNPDLKLLPGMTASVRIVTAQKSSVLRVPNAALRFRPTGVGALPSAAAGSGVGAARASGSRTGLGAGAAASGVVWVVGSDGAPVAVSLRLGISDGTATEVLEGDLREGQEVLVGTGTPSVAAPARGPRLGF